MFRAFLTLVTCASFAITLAGCQVTERQLQTIMENRGFKLLVPPSTLYGPGSLVNLQNYDPKIANPKAVQLGFLCNPEYSVSRYSKKPIASETLGEYTVTDFGGGFSASIPALRRILDITANANGKVTLSGIVADAKIYAFAQDDLEIIRGMLGPECTRIVNRNIPRNAYQVIQVLQANIDITATFDASVDASAKAKIVSELAKASFTLSGESTATLKGQALFFGVQIIPVTEPIREQTAPPSIVSPPMTALR